ncbi:sulfate transporter family-domain-containing protein [Dipodascopsis uninucleata]
MSSVEDIPHSGPVDVTGATDSSRLLENSDSASVRSTSSRLSFLGSPFRSRILSFNSTRSSGVEEHDYPTAHLGSTVDNSYVGFDQASVSDTSTILGAPRHRVPATMRHHHNNTHSLKNKERSGSNMSTGPNSQSYGALGSSASLSSCASQMPEPNMNLTETESYPDPRLFSESRKDRFLAKSKYYAKYYFPILTWLPSYPVKTALAGDVIAGLTSASFNLPLSLSYARTLSHVPERYGLLGFCFPQLIYACMGTVACMITGPEPALCVMIGQAIVPYIMRGNPSPEEQDQRAIIYVALISLTSTILYFVMGIFRLAYLDAILSDSVLKGFVWSVGVVLTMDTLIPGLGLSKLAAETGASTSSAGVKLGFILTHLNKAHALSAAMFLIAFSIIILMRVLRNFYAKRFKFLLYIPDIFFIVVFSIIITWKKQWDMSGVEVVGYIPRPDLDMMSPLNSMTMEMFREILPSAVIISLLGFFSTATIAKNIFPDPPVDPRMTPPKNPIVSMNRELIALGAANLIGTFQYAVPSIGGYGRSKANKISGARTQLSSVVFSIVAFIVTFGMLPLIYYLPRPILASVLGLICVALLEDSPMGIWWYIKLRAWSDLAMALLIIGITLGTSLQTGVSVGLVISLLQILKQATRARIQVLARVPGTVSTFRDADNPSRDVSKFELANLEHVPGVLLVRIPESLTFANSAQLETRLRRLERYGTMKMHPSLPSTRGEQHVIMDMENMHDCDTSSVKVLCAIVEAYRSKGKYVLFVGLPDNQEMKKRFKLSGMERQLSYNGHRPAYYPTIESALDALDECVYETPGDWNPEDDIDVVVVDGQETSCEADDQSTEAEGATEVGSHYSNEKLLL